MDEICIIVPPVTANLLIDVAPFRLRLPAERLSCPVVPDKTPLSVALPPEMFNAPLTEVAPETVRDPPEIIRELLLLIVRLEMVSVPVVLTHNLWMLARLRKVKKRALPLQKAA